MHTFFIALTGHNFSFLTKIIYMWSRWHLWWKFCTFIQNFLDTLYWCSFSLPLLACIHSKRCFSWIFYPCKVCLQFSIPTDFHYGNSFVDVKTLNENFPKHSLIVVFHSFDCQNCFNWDKVFLPIFFYFFYSLEERMSFLN